MSGSRLMQVERKHPSVSGKIAVCRENGPVATDGDCANEKVSIRSLNAHGSASVEALSRLFEVSTLEREIGEGAEMASQQIELQRFFEPGEEFLSNRSDHHHAAFADDLGHLPNDRRGRLALTPKRQCPDGRVDQHLHARRRCFLKS